MDKGYIYSYFDEVGKLIVVVHKNTPQETIERLKKKYDEVKFKE